MPPSLSLSFLPLPSYLLVGIGEGLGPVVVAGEVYFLGLAIKSEVARGGSGQFRDELQTEGVIQALAPEPPVPVPHPPELACAVRGVVLPEGEEKFTGVDVFEPIHALLKPEVRLLADHRAVVRDLDLGGSGIDGKTGGLGGAREGSR